ncbi:AraC family transcriptional regulator [Jeotgalibacillus proteolyticus]|uniref:AraC family transcriptional regulator n=1 Tax=Jeotgalibacillus proteolyticus TaxID=2082395 RepID=A0A2S5G9G6_9BACL|nr:AraC family transcriptional regulator [Jeotgalibacillus proteolyticus]PPA69640.1 AraC family transcriptional regulator [Jeotgalibacillus proteolyticus]
MEEIKKRYVFTSLEKTLPLFIESIGYNPYELSFSRPDGYPYFHWLQTVEGEGTVTFSGQNSTLKAGNGVLLMPFTPHSYSPSNDKWSTMYLTFGGAAVDAILDSLEINYSALYAETNKDLFAALVENMIINVEKMPEFSGLEFSNDLYHFIIKLKKYGKINNQPSLSQYYAKISPVVNWIERKYADNIGLPEMAEQGKMSPQYLNTLFRDTFGISPYSFLIQIRIRESKKHLISNYNASLKEISKLVGFNDVSHFVATFRKKEGMTPAKYRSLHQSQKIEIY